MVELVYQRGEFSAADTELVAKALFWFAFSLPFNGLFLILTRTFFSLQRPWVPTWIAAINLVLTAGVCAALYEPFGVGGIVAATAIATLASVVAQMVVLRRQLGGIEIPRLIDGADPDHHRLGACSPASPTSSGTCSTARSATARSPRSPRSAAACSPAALVYLGAILALRVPEATAAVSWVLRR